MTTPFTPLIEEAEKEIELYSNKRSLCADRIIQLAKDEDYIKLKEVIDASDVMMWQVERKKDILQTLQLSEKIFNETLEKIKERIGNLKPRMVDNLQDFRKLQKEINSVFEEFYNQTQIRCRGVTNHYEESVKSSESGGQNTQQIGSGEETPQTPEHHIPCSLINDNSKDGIVADNSLNSAKESPKEIKGTGLEAPADTEPLRNPSGKQGSQSPTERLSGGSSNSKEKKQ